MEDYLQPNTYNSYYWSLDQLDDWNDAVSRDCDWSIFPIFYGQEVCYSEGQTANSLSGLPLSSGNDVGTIIKSHTGPMQMALQAQEQHPTLIRHTSSSVTSGQGSATSMISPRFSTPSLTDVSTIVPGCSPSISEERGESRCSQSPRPTRSNGPVGNRSWLSPADPIRSLSLPIPGGSASMKDGYVCLFAGCEGMFKRVEDLRRHGLKHIGLVFSCPITSCDRPFTRKDKLFEHARQMHPESPSSKFETVDLQSKINTKTTFAGFQDNRPSNDSVEHANDACIREITRSPSGFDSDYSENACTLSPSIHSQSHEIDYRRLYYSPLDTLQESVDVWMKRERSSQDTDPNTMIPASKAVSHDQSDSISLSLWPPQYLALLDLGVIEKIEAVLKSDIPQSGTSDGSPVYYDRIDKSLRLTGTSQRVSEAKILVLEGIESLASDSEARAKQELWSRHVAPDPTVLPSGGGTDMVHHAKVDDAKLPILDGTNLRAFVLREGSDEDLIKSWHDTVLPALNGLLCSVSDPSIVVTLQREGLDEASSQATICISSSITIPELEKSRLDTGLLSLLPETLRNSCKVKFTRGSIQRSGSPSKPVTYGRYDPPICAPRNRQWSRKPAMGASIGRGGSQDDTATLGGYLLIDGVPHILTVHHLFEEETGRAHDDGPLRKGQYQITQPSAQELRDIRAEILSLQDRIGRFEAEQATLLEWMSQLRELDKLQNMIPRDERLWHFGKVIASSGYRSRLPRKAPDAQSSFGGGLGLPIEMDWAACAVPEDRVGINEIGTPEHCLQISSSDCEPSTEGTRQAMSTDDNRCTRICETAGGVPVHSLGRTSHYQTGVVSPCGAWVRQSTAGRGFRSSLEWIIMRPASHSITAWSEGGMGVDGDSGSWIVREDSNDLMGLLWGRIQNDACCDPITLFTPIQDVFDDIVDTIGPKSLCLPPRALPFAPEPQSAGPVIRPSNKRKTQEEMLPPPKKRVADTLTSPQRCGKCFPPPSSQLQVTPPGTPTGPPPGCGTPQHSCGCALVMSPPATPASQWTERDEVRVR